MSCSSSRPDKGCKAAHHLNCAGQLSNKNQLQGHFVVFSGRCYLSKRFYLASIQSYLPGLLLQMFKIKPEK